MAEQRSEQGSGHRLDVSRTKDSLIVLVLVVSLVGNGCAGVVMGSNHSATSAGGGSATPATPSSTNAQQAQLSATPASASFPMVTVGASSSQTITLQNSGNAGVTISAANVTGAGFGTSGLVLPMSIPAGQNATFNIAFAPSTAGTSTGSISLVSNAPTSPLVIPVSGTALASTPLLSSSTNSLDFGSVLVGTTASLGVTLTNAGNANVTISNVAISGAGFSVSGPSANTTLTPGQTASLNVTFAPSAAGTAIGSITVASSAGTVSIALTGSGGQQSSHTVLLNWDPSTSVVVGYYVYRASANSTYAKINPAPAVLTAFTDPNIQSGQTYTYVVTAVDANNVESDYSDPVVAAIP